MSTTTDVSSEGMPAYISEMASSFLDRASEILAPVSNKLGPLFNEAIEKTGLKNVSENAYSMGDKAISFYKKNSLPVNIVLASIATAGTVYAVCKYDFKSYLPESVQKMISK